MTPDALPSPGFGQADLTNCERELIHLAGSVQPHGVLLVLAEPQLDIVQVSANTERWLGRATGALLGRPIDVLGGDLGDVLRRCTAGPLSEPAHLRGGTEVDGNALLWDLAVHRVAGAGLVVELEAVDPDSDAALLRAGSDGRAWLQTQIGAAIELYGLASTLGGLADAIARSVRDLTGYDRVMVYKFDPDGHGKIISEARDPRLESLLNHRYPATDIPQRARELYIRNRVRVLVDVDYVPAPLVPSRLPGGAELDMSLCRLRSMSPLHLQYLKNMGVTATLVASLVREGRLWGLIACHHYSMRRLHPAAQAAVGLLAEVAATRITAIENYAYAQVAILVRRLERRLVEATATEGDWRQALFRNPGTVLHPLEASGAALFDDGDVFTIGEVPSTPELRALCQWIDGQFEARPDDALFGCSSVGRANAQLQSLTPVASGVLAVRLAPGRSDYLMWFRKEQLQSVTWAGDPTKPMLGNDPRELSPRRSFAAWSEIVRGTALPWSGAELALARAIGAALADIVVQVQAVRLLVAEHQIAGVRAKVQASAEAVVVAAAGGRILLMNAACSALFAVGPEELADLDALAARCTDAASLRSRWRAAGAGAAWRGELEIARGDGVGVPVAVRIEAVPGRDGSALGVVLVFADLSGSKRAEQARRHLEDALALAAASAVGGRRSDHVINAILTNASVAAMDIADAIGGPAVAPLLEEVEESTLRAAALYGQIRAYTEGR